jgi:16S rRNA (guanine527-N7)-methyltransferase
MSVETEAFGEAEFQAAAGADSEQMGDLQSYLALLSERSQVMNLVGPSALSTFWRRHAWDSAQLQLMAPEARVWADVGAGAGFPGVILAILMKRTDGAKVHLVESMAKRCRFLHEAVEKLSLPAMVHNVRGEDARIPNVEVVTARACAPLPRLLSFTEPFFRGGAVGIFLKGKDAEAEIADAKKHWRFRSSLSPSRSDPSGNIVKVEGLSRV